MPTLIRRIGSGRGKTRVCSAHCYDAKGDTCTCICGGMNHRKGLEEAIKLTRDHGVSAERGPVDDISPVVRVLRNPDGTTSVGLRS